MKTLTIALGIAICLVIPSAFAELLVAPTRIELAPDQRFAELTIVNKGEEEAAFRISLENRRMQKDGSLIEAPETRDDELFALDFLRHAPRRVILKPGEKQTIRISTSPNLPSQDGEFRSHLRFMSVPVNAGRSLQSATANNSDSLSIQLIAIRAITIPVIYRQGNLEANVSVEDLYIDESTEENQSLLITKLKRSGDRSTYGNIVFYRQGEEKPVYLARGIAIYTPNTERDVILPIPDAVRDLIENQEVTIVYEAKGDAKSTTYATQTTKLLAR